MIFVKLEESGVKKRLVRILAVVATLLTLTAACACAQSTISTTVVMRVSRMTQNAIVDVGEDLSMEVNIDGVEPERYQWYFNGEAIEGANQKVYNIVNATVEDAGTYRMDAFDGDGRMVVSMDIAARVIDDAVPQSGDASLPVSMAFAGMAVCAGLAVVLWRQRIVG